MEVKLTNMCDIDENGNPKVLSGTSVLLETNRCHSIYDKAEKESKNIVKKPIARKSDGTTIDAYELQDR